MIRSLSVSMLAGLPSVLWAALLVALPITSFPLLARLGGSPIISPASALFLAFLLITWFGPYVYRRGGFPAEISPLVFFVLVAIVSSAFGLFLAISPYKDQTPLDREVRALLTLLLGVAFYAVATVYVDSKKELTRSIKFINLGGIVLLIWALGQAVVIHFFAGDYPDAMTTIHRWISLRDPMSTRVTGLAYEPSWMASMLSILYIPIWLGMVVNWRSVYRHRIWIFPLEFFLLLLGVAAIFLGQSRIGVVSLTAMLGLLALILAVRSAKSIRQRVDARGVAIGGLARKARGVALTLALLLLFSVAFVSIAVVAAYLAGKLDWRLDRLIDGTVFRSIGKDLGYVFSYRFARALRFAERTAYWSASLEVFKQYPLLGVGLGNTGFFFIENIPTFGWRAPEVVAALDAAALNFVNPKNLWIRILAETGIVGFTFIMVWLLLVLLRAWQLLRERFWLHRTMGLVGLLALTAVLVEGFSLDSFALPYMWISLGLISATALFSTNAATRDANAP